MCSRAFLLALIASVSVARPAYAQDSNEAARQRALVDSLLPQWFAVQLELLRADSVDRARRQGHNVAVDTAMIGPFTVIAPDEQASEHFRNFRRAVAERALMLEGLQAGGQALFAQRDGVGPLLRFQAERSNAPLLRIYGSSPRVRERSTRVAVDNAIYRYLPITVRTWLGTDELARGRELGNVYREMATSPAPEVRECHRGNAAACLAALGLNAESTGGFSPAARASLLMHALSVGPPGAVARLNTAAALTPGEALQRASRLDLSQLVRNWRSDIASEYVSYAGLARASVAAMLWAVASLLLALRSTRRRAE